MRKRDEKLLEKVAAFHGIEARWFEIQKWKNAKGRKWYVGDGPRFQAGVDRVFGPHNLRPWNPLENSALALSLAAEYELVQMHHNLLVKHLGKPEVAKLGKEEGLRHAIVCTLADLEDMKLEQEKEQKPL